MRTYTVVDTVMDQHLIPDDVMDDIREAWADYELGNDCHYLRSEYILASYDEDNRYPNLAAWLQETFEYPKEVLIHFWW